MVGLRPVKNAEKEKVKKADAKGEKNASQPTKVVAGLKILPKDKKKQILKS